MADEPEDVLELEEADIVDDEAEEQGEANEGTEAGDDDADESDVIGFGEEAAPASEDETSTIRQMREKLRESQRRIAELERAAPPKPKVEVGAKPTLADVDYDEDRFEAALDAWKARKAEAERAEHEEQEASERSREEWAGRVRNYETGKSKLKVSDFAEAEETVFAALKPDHRALLMTAPDPAALVYALSKDAAKLDQLAKLDLMNAAKMVGKLEDKVTVTRRKPPQPDTPLSGNSAGPGTSDRELAALKAKAEKSGDYSAYFEAKRARA